MTDGGSHPDFILAVIPTTLFAAYVVGAVLDAGLVAVMVAVGICYLLMVDGLFWHGP